MRIVFFGTPEFAVPSFKALSREFEVVLAITQPDRPTGRGLIQSAPPVKVAAEELGIEVIQPEVVKGQQFFDCLRGHAPDFLITAAFGRMLGSSIVSADQWVCLNVHGSLLPRHRGAAPANYAILCGDLETGISITRMTKKLDAGPIYYAARAPILPEETAGELLLRLAELGAESIVYVLKHFGELKAREQDETEVTWARSLKKEDGVIDWQRNAVELARHVRGMHPWPVAVTSCFGSPLQVHSARLLDEAALRGTPGAVVAVSKEGIDVACGKGTLRLIEVQAPGKKRMHAAQFLLGNKLKPGSVLGC